MMGLPAGTRIWIAAGVTDMRAGMNSLAAKVQLTLDDDPLSGHVFVFRGRRGNVVKVLWATTDGVCLLAKRLERGHFVWPQACWRRLKIDPVGVRRNTWSVFGRHQQSQRLCVIKGETVSLACR